MQSLVKSRAVACGLSCWWKTSMLSQQSLSYKQAGQKWIQQQRVGVSKGGQEHGWRKLGSSVGWKGRSGHELETLSVSTGTVLEIDIHCSGEQSPAEDRFSYESYMCCFRLNLYCKWMGSLQGRHVGTRLWVLYITVVSWWTTRNTHTHTHTYIYIYIYKNIRLYFYSWWWYLCGAEEQLQRVLTHKEVVGSRKSQWTTDFSQNSGTYIVYNSHVTWSNSCLPVVMVTPTFHFFVFHWLQFTSMCSLFPIGYLPKPTSMGGHICHDSLSSTTSIDQGTIYQPLRSGRIWHKVNF